MSKNTLILILVLIVVIFLTITIKGFLILGTVSQDSDLTISATTTTNIPDNLSISDELGG